MNKSSLLKWFPVAVLVILIAIMVGCGGGDATSDNGTPAEGSLQIPVNFSGADNVGSIHMELVYDSLILKATDVKAGSLIRNGVVEANTDTPGRAVI